MLNALLWSAKVEVPADGVESKVTKEQLDAKKKLAQKDATSKKKAA